MLFIVLLSICSQLCIGIINQYLYFGLCNTSGVFFIFVLSVSFELSGFMRVMREAAEELHAEK